jgi:hypothetical protein
LIERSEEAFSWAFKEGFEETGSDGHADLSSLKANAKLSFGPSGGMAQNSLRFCFARGPFFD